MVVLEVLDFVNDCDALTLAPVGGLANPQPVLVSVLVEITYKLSILVGHYEGQRCECVDLAVELLHFLNQAS